MGGSDDLLVQDGGGIEMTLERLLATAATTSTGGGGAREQLWEVEEDPDLQDDPLMQLDIQVCHTACDWCSSLPSVM